MRSILLTLLMILGMIAGCGGISDSPESKACSEYETTGDVEDFATVSVLDANGTTVAEVEARVADSPRERCIGLSELDSLDTGEGMLFVFDETATRTFVMRGMSFPLDIIFIAANGTITRIHHAPTEEPPLTAYEGRGKYVLEVPRGWAAEQGVQVGDRIVVQYGKN